MLLDYYNNVSSLHSSIRSMRHDLSNHLAALSFMSMGESAADPDRQTLMSTSGVADESEEPGGCTPPGDPRRCAEASRRALCGAGALCAPDDPGRFATGVPGDAFCGYSTPVIPGGSNDSRDAYLRSLLDACSEIDRQIAAQTAWSQIDTDALSSREKYEIHHYVTTVMQKHQIPASALCITTETGDGSTEISLRIDAGSKDTSNLAVSPAAAADAATSHRPKPLRLPLLRHGTMFRLIKLIAQSHGGDAVWRKDRDGYALVVSIRQGA